MENDLIKKDAWRVFFESEEWRSDAPAVMPCYAFTCGFAKKLKMNPPKPVSPA
jgi:hypothetical protein